MSEAPGQECQQPADAHVLPADNHTQVLTEALMLDQQPADPKSSDADTKESLPNDQVPFSSAVNRLQSALSSKKGQKPGGKPTSSAAGAKAKCKPNQKLATKTSQKKTHTDKNTEKKKTVQKKNPKNKSEKKPTQPYNKQQPPLNNKRKAKKLNDSKKCVYSRAYHATMSSLMYVC